MTPVRNKPLAIPIQRSSTSNISGTRWNHLTHRLSPTTIPPFVYGVTTTKIYCLPTCPSRLARRANVVFYDNPLQAQKRGFRACRRCKPERASCFFSASESSETAARSKVHQCITAEAEFIPCYSRPDVKMRGSSAEAQKVEGQEGPEEEEEHIPTTTKIAHAVQLIQTAASEGKRLSLAGLAAQVGLSKWHLQRVFKIKIGQSPKKLGDDLVNALSHRTEIDIPVHDSRKLRYASGTQGMINLDFTAHTEANTLAEANLSAPSPNSDHLINDLSASSCITSTVSSTTETSPSTTAYDCETAEHFQGNSFWQIPFDALAMEKEFMLSNFSLDPWSPNPTEDVLLHDLFPEIYI